jgi:hypothetical protein
MGIAILMSPLQIPDDWETGKTEDERAAVLARLRADEVKWGWRCLWATVVLVCVLGIVGAVIYLCKVF